MRILQIHNTYKIAGGEDAVVHQEHELLSSRNAVFQYTVDNESVNSTLSKIRAFFSSIFSIFSFFKVIKIIKKTKPDIVHVHNYFPLISPSVFWVCKYKKIPIVHTLHNYRAVCPTSLLMHNGKINETSIRSSAWWAVKHKVYRSSFIGSFSLALMVEIHKKIGTWQTKVDRFIALTQFSKNKYISAGWPENKIAVKPNFMSDPHQDFASFIKKGGYALFVGRLSEEKGVGILYDAWSNINFPLKIIGSGPLLQEVEKNTSQCMQYLGLKNKTDVLELIKNASFVVMPSVWYEGFPMVIVESFACGTPVVCSRLGSMKEIVDDKMTGLHFEAGNADDLAEKVNMLIANPQELQRMGKNARKEYEEKYTPGMNLDILMDIYQHAIDQSIKDQNNR